MGCDPSGNGMTDRYIEEEQHMQNNATCGLYFSTIAQAERVLRPHKIIERLKVLIDEGFDLSVYTQADVAAFIGASRERTCLAMGELLRGDG